MEQADDTYPRGRSDARVAGALLAAAEGDEDRALELLDEALLAAAPFALRRPFLAGPALVDLLARRLERGSAASEFAVDLLGRWSPDGERRAFVDPLTERMHRAALPADLPVERRRSPPSSTSRSTRSRPTSAAVYRKLGAAGRREAVRRARVLGLL